MLNSRNFYIECTTIFQLNAFSTLSTYIQRRNNDAVFLGYGFSNPIGRQMMSSVQDTFYKRGFFVGVSLDVMVQCSYYFKRLFAENARKWSLFRMNEWVLCEVTLWLIPLSANLTLKWPLSSVLAEMDFKRWWSCKSFFTNRAYMSFFFFVLRVHFVVWFYCGWLKLYT